MSILVNLDGMPFELPYSCFHLLVIHCNAAPMVEQKPPTSTTQLLGQHRLAASNRPPTLSPNLHTLYLISF